MVREYGSPFDHYQQSCFLQTSSFFIWTNHSSLQGRENTTPMRGSRLPPMLRRSVNLPRPFVKTPFHAICKAKSSASVTPRRTLPWTQHPLKTNSPSENDVTKLSKTQSQPRLAYIALGSNLGDRVGWIETACNKMSQRGIRVKRTSGLWETEPMYVLDQENFLNGACEVSLFSQWLGINS